MIEQQTLDWMRRIKRSDMLDPTPLPIEKNYLLEFDHENNFVKLNASENGKDINSFCSIEIDDKYFSPYMFDKKTEYYIPVIIELCKEIDLLRRRINDLEYESYRGDSDGE